MSRFNVRLFVRDYVNPTSIIITMVIILLILIAGVYRFTRPRPKVQPQIVEHEVEIEEEKPKAPKMIEEEYGEPYSSPDIGWRTFHSSINDEVCTYRRAFYVNGKKANSHYGHHQEITICKKIKGRWYCASVEYKDMNGRTVMSSHQGYAFKVWWYDEEGRCVLAKCFDQNLKPCMCIQGWCTREEKWGYWWNPKKEINEENKGVFHRVLYKDTKDRPTVPKGQDWYFKETYWTKEGKIHTQDKLGYQLLPHPEVEKK
jgi:hypothetical protein